MAMALVTTLRWNSTTRVYDRVDHEIERTEYPGMREYTSTGHGPGLVAFPYGIDDSPRSLREQVGRYANLWGRDLGRLGQCRSRVRRAQEALEAGDMDAVRAALDEAYRG
jgi:hypothetical protein